MSETSNIRKTCVAVVDDDESLCRAFCRLLRAAGLVLDIQLGGMSGIELHQRLNASGSRLVPAPSHGSGGPSLMR